MILLPDFVFVFISIKESESMVEISFRFPSIFGQGVPFPYGQVQSLASGDLVREDGFNFILLFVIYDIRRQG